MSRPVKLPRWMDVAVLPAVNLAMAWLVCAVVVARWSGFDPARCWRLLVKGAFGSKAGISYTLYYATTFVFTGLAVAVAFHGGLFNIGGEGQAMMGGLGAGLVALCLGGQLPGLADAAGMVLALRCLAWPGPRCPGALQAWRGSHIGHHHHHVQLHGRGAAELPAGQRAEGARQHDGGKPRLRRIGACARHARAAGLRWASTGRARRST
jgi:hypothetical protein